MAEELQDRTFRGIWIPAEIWLRDDIGIAEKCLWGEINSLSGKEDEGCYASNDYFAEFFQLKTSRIKAILKNLRDKGLVKTASFDGRKRFLHAVFLQADGQDTGYLTARILAPSSNRNSPGHININYNKVDNKDPNTKVKVPKKQVPKKPYGPDGVVLLTDSELEKLHAKLTVAGTNRYIEKLNNYILAKDPKYKSHYHVICMWISNEEDKGSQDKTVTSQQPIVRTPEEIARRKAEYDLWKKDLEIEIEHKEKLKQQYGGEDD